MKYLFTIFVLIFMACGGGPKPQKTAPPTIPKSAKSVLMVIAPNNFRDEEFKEPYDLFKANGFRVTIASTDTTPAKGMLGVVVKPEIVLEQVMPDSFDALVVVGGTGCKVLWDNATLHNIVRDFADKGKTIGAICIGPVVLARAGIIKEKKVTAYPSVRNEIEKVGARYTGTEVEEDGNIITGAGPKFAHDFALKLLAQLQQ